MTPHEETIQTVKAIIRRSDLWSPSDPPETVAAIMVLHVCRYFGVDHEYIPETLLRALSVPDGSRLPDTPEPTAGSY